MAKKVSITPLQQRILALLEEAGAEDICTLFNSVAGLDIRLSHQEVRMQIESALRALVKLGLVEIEGSEERSIGKVMRAVEWDEKVACWVRTGERVPDTVLITEKGIHFLQT